MPPSLRLAYFAHALRSDWNNGNAHFLRGLLRALALAGHNVTAFEPEPAWSIDNLRTEPAGERSLQRFHELYTDLNIHTYPPESAEAAAAAEDMQQQWRERLRNTDIVILHEWNPPALAQMLLQLRKDLGYKLLFHDTHHRASSSPEQMRRLGLQHFDGILVFGEALRTIYRERFRLQHVWTLHEAADTSVFHPQPDTQPDAQPDTQREAAVVWIGNWGDGERSAEIGTFLLQPACALRDLARTTIYGVRYPEQGLAALRRSGVHYGGYLPNLDAPAVYARARATIHVPRQQYSQVMCGIPTIRVFEALACGIPLVSAPWHDTEHLFRKGDYLSAQSTEEMTRALRLLLTSRHAAEDQAARGLETILARHTCTHRARQLTSIFQELPA